MNGGIRGITRYTGTSTGTSTEDKGKRHVGTVERRLVVTEEAGLHARPAAAFAQAAARTAAEVTVARADADTAGKRVPAHSVLLVLTLDIRCGDEIVLRAGGPDADSALDALVEIVAPV